MAASSKPRCFISAVMALLAVCTFAFASGPTQVAFAQVVVSDDGAVASDADSGLALEGFHRAQKGSASPLPDGSQVGYRYITGASDNAVLVALADAAVLYVPESVADRRGIDVENAAAAQALAELFQVADAEHADGGVPLSGLLDQGVSLAVTVDTAFAQGPYLFRFAVQADGRTYAAVDWADRANKGAAGAAESGNSGAGGAHAETEGGARPLPSGEAAAGTAGEKGGTSGGTPRVLFCDYAQLVPASQAAPAQTDAPDAPTTRLAAFLAGVDYSPLFVSLRTACAATLLAFVIGVLCAWGSLRLGSRMKSVVDVLFLVPMVLPPTACGLLLVYVFGKNSPTGQWLISAGIDLPFTWPAAVIAALVVALPFMYRSARGAFENMDPDMMDAARTLGWSEARVFAQLMVPLSAPSLVAGAVLTFSRALGEFGATVFFAGNYAGVTQTIPLAIYYDWMAGDATAAIFWVCVTLLFMFVFLMLMNRIAKT